MMPEKLGYEWRDWGAGNLSPRPCPEFFQSPDGVIYESQ